MTSNARCLTYLLRTDDTRHLKALDMHHFSTRLKSKVVILTNNQSMTTVTRKSYEVMVALGRQRLWTYSPSMDPSWKNIKVSWAPFRPYVYTDHNGNVAGMDLDVWKIVKEKIGLQMRFNKMAKALVKVYLSLPRGRSDLAIPGTAYTNSMLKVS